MSWRRKKDGKFAPLVHLPSFIFRIMIPWYLLIFQNFWNFNKASQVYTLSVSDDNFLLLNTCITYIICIVSNILLWQPGAKKQYEWRWKREKKIYIIKYKANKLCCYIDVHIWYKNFSNKKNERSIKMLASLYDNSHSYTHIFGVGRKAKRNIYDLWYLKTLESIFFAHIFKKFAEHSICSKDKTSSRDVNEDFPLLPNLHSKSTIPWWIQF